MHRFSATIRIAVGVVCVTVGVLFLAHALGLIPDPAKAVAQGRMRLCEAMAVHCSLVAQAGDEQAVAAATELLAGRNPDVRSAGVRSAAGRLIATVGPHIDLWKPGKPGRNGETLVEVPIFNAAERWGAVEIVFRDANRATGYWSYLRLPHSPFARLLIFFSLAGFMSCLLFLRKTLRHLDPTAVIPQRVRAMLDVLAEGVVVLDKDERIVLANDAFARLAGRTFEQLQGQKVSEIPWTTPRTDAPPQAYPWLVAASHGSVQRAVPLALRDGSGAERALVVNACPIHGGDGSCRGALATFDDVTEVERVNAELRASRDEVARQNNELQVLATRDSLTGCLNRRSFMEQLEHHWNTVKRYGGTLGCILLDVDHFKSINDRFGHSAGDRVLREVAEVLRATAREVELICRYGGEEFCVLLPQTGVDGTEAAAERLRQALEGRDWGEMRVTASFGVSSTELGSRGAKELLDEADAALYAAKRSGRNRVVRWGAFPRQEGNATAGATAEETGNGAPTSGRNVPVQVVAGLISALTCRDSSTAAHCRRVAKLCLAAASGLVPPEGLRELEVAALLHDIGKLGVPDAVLFKPAALTESEWKIMRSHDRMGVDILTAALANPQITNIVSSHHAFYGGSSEEPALPTGNSIPTGARLLAIADAFDAMVSDRVYRKGRSRDEAFAELRRCAGSQFDPDLVERFIQVVSATEQEPAVQSAAVPTQTTDLAAA